MHVNIPELVARQRAFFRTGATRAVTFRRKQLEKLAETIQSHEQHLSDALYADLRKSPDQAYGSEIGLVINEIQCALRNLKGWARPRRGRLPYLSWPGRGQVHREPFGVVLVIGAWNYPVQLSLMPLVSAMAAGNCVILKPSEIAPRTAEAIIKMIQTAFVPEFVTAIAGSSDEVHRLIACRLDKIFFTGSRRAGTSVMAAAAVHPTPVTLELGGKSPCVVCADAPIDVTARRIVWGKFMNAGQTCVAPDFVLADRKIHDSLIDTMRLCLREFYGDDPARSPDYGRIVNQSHFARLTKYLDDGRVVHGGTFDEKDLYLAPTLLVEAGNDSSVMTDEIFGPILPVAPFDDINVALETISAMPIPLAAYLFTKDVRVQERFVDRIRSGGVCINDVVSHMVGTGLPFGGLGESGFGAYHGETGFDCFSHGRTIVRRWFKPDIRLRYPPSKVSLKTLKRAFLHLLRS